MRADASRRSKARALRDGPCARSTDAAGREAWQRRRHQSLEQRILLTATLCLLAFGAVMVYSASSATTLLQGQGNGSSYLIKYVAYGAVGLVADARAGPRRGGESAEHHGARCWSSRSLLVLAVHIPHVGVSVNGARRWIGPGSLQFQPSELLKLALVLYAADAAGQAPAAGARPARAGQPAAGGRGRGLPAGRHPARPRQRDGDRLHDCAALLVAAGIPPRKLALLAGGVLAVVFLYALARPYARARLTSFLDPWAHASGSGFQAVQGQIAIGSGGLFGVGPGQSVQKIFYLPEAPTDFILAVIAEELGVVGVCALLFLYGLIAYAGLRAAKAARSLYSALIAVGVTALILSQAMLNVFAVLGLAPLTGVPLPFVSYGSSSLIVMLAAMGLLLNVAAGGTAHVRAVAPARARSRDARGREPARWSRERSTEEDRDRRGRDRRARRAGAGGGGGAAG